MMNKLPANPGSFYLLKSYTMKYITTLALACILSLQAQAQKGLYMVPAVGLGISNTTTRTQHTPGYQASPLFTYQVQAGLGYRLNKWRFQSGLFFFRSGYNPGDLMVINGYNPDGTPVKTQRYNMVLLELGVPLQLGYTIPVTNRLHIMPAAGLMASYLFTGYSKVKDGSGYHFSNRAMDNYGRFALWGTLGAEFAYQLNSSLALTCGPALQYKVAGGNINLYNAMLQVGLKKYW